MTVYLCTIQESDIIDMIAECENDEQQGRMSYEGKRPNGSRGPKVCVK